MNDYTLKFRNENEAIEVLKEYKGSIDIIGTIYKPTNKLDAEGNAIMAAIAGWHVNARGPEDSVLLAYHVEVLTPERVWA